MPKTAKQRVNRARDAKSPDPNDLYADALPTLRRWHRETLDELADIVESQKNRNFVQFYPAGFALLQRLLDDPKTVMAGRLFLLLAEHSNRQNILLASQSQLADALKVHAKTIQRASKVLEGLHAVKRIKFPGAGYVYCLPPSMIWRGKDNEKDAAPFETGRLEARQAEGDFGPTKLDFRAFTGPSKKSGSPKKKEPTEATASTISREDPALQEDFYASDADIGL